MSKSVSLILPNHLPGLDGLRAIFAIAILWGHVPQSDFCNWGGQDLTSPSWLPPCCAYMFFVLSGFLAGYKGGSGLNVSAYYGKRAKKILPLYYGYILACVLAFWAMGRLGEVINVSLLYYLSLLPGVPFSMSSGIVPMVHLWFIGSLVLFYAVFPFFTKLKEESMYKAAMGITVGWVLLKWGLYAFWGKDTFAYRFVSVTAFDCLFFGVLLGLLWKRKNAILIRIGNSRPLAILMWSLFLLSGFYGNYIPAPIRNEYMALIGGLLMLNLLSSHPLLSLENKVLTWIGSISYEMYVVQILVIMLLSMLYARLGWYWHEAVIYLACSIAVICVAFLLNGFLLRKKS